MLNTNDLLNALGGLIGLLKEKEMREAVEAVDRARRHQSAAVYDKRAAGINEIAKTIHRLKQQREAILRQIETLPEEDRFDARHHIAPVVQEVVDAEICRLRSQKRRLSAARF